MKKTTKRRKLSTDSPSLPPQNTVRFEMVNPTAKTIFVAGTFNGWHPAVTEMVAVGKGRWVTEVALAPGRYEYRLVVDGEWIADPGASSSVPNPYGGVNSVVEVAS